MPVDPSKPSRVLVVHGVQSSTDAEQNQHEDIAELIRARLNGVPVEFETEMYRYENINDRAQKKFKRLAGMFTTALTGKLTLQRVAGFTLDVVGDVVIALQDGTTAAAIRKGLRERILEIYEEGNPLYVVAHSLGTVYALDVVNQLMKEADVFDRSRRKTWPVQGLVTLGSPLGLSMFKRSKVTALGEGRKFFRWHNYWSRTDPVVSCSLYGKPRTGYEIAERFHTDATTSGWFIQDHIVDMGKVWLMAHFAYWDHAPIGDDLAALITN
jgi:hypothetical protein